MKTLLRIALYIVAVVLIAVLGTYLSPDGRWRVRYVLHAQADYGMSHWFHVKSLGAQPGQIHETDGFIGKRRNNDVVSMGYFASGIRVVKFAATGTEVQISDDGLMKSTYRFGGNTPVFGSFGGCYSSDESKKPEDHKTIYGFPVVRVISEQSQRLTREDWRAPDFNCETLEYTATFRTDGSDGAPGLPDGVTYFTTVRVTLDEPDPALFEVPDSAVETKPSQFFGALGKIKSHDDVEAFAEQDAFYLNQQQQK